MALVRQSVKHVRTKRAIAADGHLTSTDLESVSSAFPAKRAITVGKMLSPPPARFITCCRHSAPHNQDEIEPKNAKGSSEERGLLEPLEDEIVQRLNTVWLRPLTRRDSTDELPMLTASKRSKASDRRNGCFGGCLFPYCVWRRGCNYAAKLRPELDLGFTEIWTVARRYNCFPFRLRFSKWGYRQLWDNEIDIGDRSKPDDGQGDYAAPRCGDSGHKCAEPRWHGSDTLERL